MKNNIILDYTLRFHIKIKNDEKHNRTIRINHPKTMHQMD